MNTKKPFYFKFFFYSLVAFLIILGGSHSFGYEWSKTFGDSRRDEGRSVQQTTDGGYIIAGYTYSYGAGGSDLYLIKTDANGNQQWSRTFGGSEYDAGSSVQQTSDGGFIIAGVTESFGAENRDVYLIKTDAYGNEQWSKTFGGSKDLTGESVQQTNDGGYIIGATTDAGRHGATEDVYLIKTDAIGNEQWSRTLGEWGDDRLASVEQTTDGGYMIGGRTWSFGGGGKFYLIKTDANGNEQWSKTFGGSKYDGAYSAKQTSDGGYILAGITQSFGAGESDVYLIKTDADGNEQWSKNFGGSDSELGISVEQTIDGGYIIAGGTRWEGWATWIESDVWLIKTDADGNEQWSKTFGGSEYDVGFSVRQTSDGGFIIAGATESFGEDSADIYLIYYKPGDYVNNHVTFEPDPSTFTFSADTSGCQTGAVGKFSFGATLTNINEKELSNLFVEVEELTNNNLLLTDEGLKGEGDIFKIATGFENVALNADVYLKGAPFFEGGWEAGQIVSKNTIVDGIYLARGQRWDQGAVWWDSGDEEDRYIEINLKDEYTINSFIVQADDNDAYKLYFLNMTNNSWQLAWDVPNFNLIQGTGMVTRPNPEDDSERYFLSNPIATDALLFRGNMDDSDRLFSLSEIQAFSGAANDYSDGYISPDEYVDVPFTVCLQDKSPFRFFVNVLGTSQINLTNTPWKMHKGEEIVLFGFVAPYYGWEGEYDFASIPSENGGGWQPAPDSQIIDFSVIPSTLCDVMNCLEGADFTYFQTFVDVPSGIKITTFSLELDGIDDGVEVKIFNSDNPGGVVAGYVLLGGHKTIDLKSFIKSGEKNRIVLTHTDDCCYHSTLYHAQLTMEVE